MISHSEPLPLAVPCKYCNKPTRFVETATCDDCYDLRRLIADRPEIARRMIGDPIARAHQTWMTETIFGDGGKCPVCERQGKAYRIRFSGSMARVLIWLNHVARNSFVHVPSVAPRFVLKANCVGKFVLWGLAETAEAGADEHKSGSWRMTETGRKFADNLIKIDSHVFTYNNKLVDPPCEAETAKQVSISDALASSGFRYPEVRAAVCRLTPP